MWTNATLKLEPRRASDLRHGDVIRLEETPGLSVLARVRWTSPERVGLDALVNGTDGLVILCDLIPGGPEDLSRRVVSRDALIPTVYKVEL